MGKPGFFGKAFGGGLLVLFLLLANLQCSHGHGVRTEELMIPLKDLKRAIHYALEDSVKTRSRNGRTYFSKYHSPGPNLKLSAHQQEARGQVSFSILGDRRPYQVVVEYTIEALGPDGKYRPKAHSKELAKGYLEKFQTYLASRPEERDIVDDFRPY